MNHVRALFVLFLFAGFAPAGAGSSPPNIVFFLVDDLGVMDTAVYGSKVYRTPNIDRLAASGMRFTEAYAAHPRCVPSRYAIMTGRYPARAGVPARRHHIRAEERTIAEMLKDRGYATFFAGKWHLMKKPDEAPEAQGFDINIGGGKTGAAPSHFAPYNVSRNPYHKTEGEIPGLDNAPDGEYLADRLTDETVAFIRRHAGETPDQPFFAVLSHYAVHTPIEAKPEMVEDCQVVLDDMDWAVPSYADRDGTTKLRQDNAVYAAMIRSTDQSLGRILDVLTELNLAEDTVVIFTSDHGGLSNRGRDNQRELATSNLPYRAGKGHLYEGGIRVPLIVTHPGMIAPGTLSSFVTHGIDHVPTIMALTGTASGDDDTDGVSYDRALTGSDDSVGRDVFWFSPRARPNGTGDRNCAALRRGSHKLLYFYDEDRVELYDLHADPGETDDRSADWPDLAAELLSALKAWMRDVADYRAPQT